MKIFRDAHPLEVIMFWTMTGLLFSLYFFIKMIPKSPMIDLPDGEITAIDFSPTVEDADEVERIAN